MSKCSFIPTGRAAIASTLLCAVAGCVSQPPAQPLSMGGRSEPPATHIGEAAALKATDPIYAARAPLALPVQAGPVELARDSTVGLREGSPGPLNVLFQTDGSAAAPAGAPVVRNEPTAAAALPAVSAKLPVAVEKFLNTIVHMDGITLFGLVAVVAMLVFYTLEERSHLCILGFALACWMGSTYGFLQGAWPFGMVEGIWGFVALRNWWQKGKPRETLDANAIPAALPIQP